MELKGRHLGSAENGTFGKENSPADTRVAGMVPRGSRDELVPQDSPVIVDELF